MKISGCENLELLLSRTRGKYYQISFKDSPAYDFMKANVPAKNLIILEIDKKKTSLKECYFSEDKMFKKTNLLDQLKRKKIEGFVPGESSSKYKEELGKKNGFKIISPHWEIRKKLENKIFFEELLTKNNLPKPKGWIIKSKKEISLVNKFPCVLQSPNSAGSQGTFFLKNKKEIEETIKSKKLKFPLLCREFINGLPFGITLLLSKEEMIFSAIRLQMFFPKKDGTNIYYGTQWVRKSDLPKTVTDEINTTMLKMGKILREQGFLGIAGFDFMIKDKKIYFIECNPRLSGPTPQVSNQKELLHNLDFAEEFIKASTNKKLAANKPFIPDTKFKGCTIDLDFLKPELLNISIKTPPKIGYYKIVGDELKYVSEKIGNYDKPDFILLKHFLLANSRITKNSTLGFAFSSEQTAEIHGNTYKFSQNSKRIFNAIKWTLEKKY